MRADWTACGACTSGSTAHPRGATRRACGGAATTSTASADGVVPRHVDRDDDGDDAAVAGPDAVALPPGRWQARRGAPRSADAARGRGLLLRLDGVRNGGFSAGRRA